MKIEGCESLLSLVSAKNKKILSGSSYIFRFLYVYFKRNRMRKVLFLCFLQLASICLFAQRLGYWQQGVDYKMEIDVDEQKFRYDGKMNLNYSNNSPETLSKVYFHLYYNAFQPGSAMDHRLVNIADPDGRMVVNIGTKENPKYESRIAQLKPEDIGFQKIKSIRQNGKNLKFKISGTILEVELQESLNPNSSTVFEMEWQAQVPQIIRRGGKNTREGVDFSMTQWYPKMAHFDEFGWHLDEYIGREFIAPFGNFDVKIKIQKDYVIGASGILKNPNEVKGYISDSKVKSEKNKTTWHFVAENIHDFAWAADKDFVVDKKNVPSGPEVFFVYQPGEKTTANWDKTQQPTIEFFEYMSKNFGKYPWKTYTIVQGGDGGMEYGTVTLITGERSFESLTGVIFHEVAHSWFQHLFGLNETVDEWMDEGFASYAENLAYLHIFDKKIDGNPNLDAYGGYFDLAKSGIEEPMSLLADYYNYNYAYGVEAYSKGQVYLIQLGYIIGEESLKKTFTEFYNQWKFKHPTPNDFKRVAEKISGINLKWYQNLFVNTTRVVDYSVKNITDSSIELENLSNFPMPVDLYVEYTDGSKELFYIPNLEMRAEKPAENFEIYKNTKRTVLEPWKWTNPGYSVKTDKKVSRAIIDPTLRLADIEYSNNIYPR